MAKRVPLGMHRMPSGRMMKDSAMHRGAMAPRKWIRGAIDHPGALRRTLKVPEGKLIPAKKLERASQQSGVTGRRARLAQTMRKLGNK